MVNFRLIGPFVNIAGFREKEIIIDAPKALKTFEFILKFEPLYERMIILVNGESGTIETVVSNDDKVKILPVIGGG
ncbi:MAG: MoaD/ThiS family protein [Candidatus Heimdallarchaeota archaeon]|nr:MoaD/ThiS family protein [Candidatus Heimdallarchaeota archaeon]MCK5047774.1 MoaD/ThiS family protein [Candidatus Heimdallarchaeota archaeon]